ncbi:MAG: hypothetical protein JOZ41_02570 [Chloroflexi bacterium]|nr:hypothetical protein [Chloroflexota bacterium]
MRLPLIAPAAALLLSLGIAHPAGATTAVVGTGTITVTPGSFQVTSFRQADGNTFITYTDAGTFTGAISGAYAETGNVITHADGSQNIRGSDSCTCTVGGRTGAYADDFWATGVASTGIAEGSVVVKGSGGLAGLHGEGTFQGTFALTTYSVRLHFDPQ